MADCVLRDRSGGSSGCAVGRAGGATGVVGAKACGAGGIEEAVAHPARAIEPPKIKPRLEICILVSLVAVCAIRLCSLSAMRDAIKTFGIQTIQAGPLFCLDGRAV